MDFSFSEDAEMVRQTVHEFVRRELLPQEPEFLNAKDPAERELIVEAATGSLKEMGLYSAGVPEAFGGGGLGPIETCLIAAELGQTIIPVRYGELTPMLYDCTDAQRTNYLTPVVQGAKSYAVAFDEPAGFSDPAKMGTTAQPTDSGWAMDGAKLVSRPQADFFLVFASAVGAIGPIGPICLILDAGAPGSTFSGNLLTLTNCFTPADHTLGVPGKALSLGRNWYPLARITRAAAMLGACERLLGVSAQYAHDWTSMGGHISERKSIQQALADMAGDIAALRWLVLHAAWLAAEGKKTEYDSLLVKLQAQKVLTETVNRSVRIHGGAIPPICAWLGHASRDQAAPPGVAGHVPARADLLHFAVARETVSRLLP